MSDCVFCRIVAGEIPARIILKTDTVLAFHDLNPQAPGHALVIPRRHIATLNDASESDRAILGDLMLAGAEVARILGFAESGYRTVTNCNPDGGQTVYHIHLHVLGGRRLSWPPG
ncbi:histidine triad (HIT) protein [Thioalkalivibrio nitratireducens DSM 14787]|uniref:Histidine triad (HIT) protein n=1 Tax=Thioalkalivibrio nitratireducens (strain DSM 14787 / UNIQEM 213 / ALEN2) TaxID=1255043 RepID=L0DU16_THIND|nr:histidine triad nucleotide-binding protein [Thioalkalivibrio nitratireducens]AGA32502.1 histidine triad (HIT) protein [Thioalkalivibrio nitratireducens DSM 14787]